MTNDYYFMNHKNNYNFGSWLASKKERKEK